MPSADNKATGVVINYNTLEEAKIQPESMDQATVPSSYNECDKVENQSSVNGNTCPNISSKLSIDTK